MKDYSKYNARTYEEYGKIWQSQKDCVFCSLKKKYIILEKEGFVLTVNIYPYIDGHLLIIPRKHIEAVGEVTKEEWGTILDLMKIGKDLLKNALGVRDSWFLYRLSDGFGGGKTVAHFHAHLVPFSEKLFKFEYQKIEKSPETIARELRDARAS